MVSKHNGRQSFLARVATGQLSGDPNALLTSILLYFVSARAWADAIEPRCQPQLHTVDGTAEPDLSLPTMLPNAMPSRCSHHVVHQRVHAKIYFEVHVL